MAREKINSIAIVAFTEAGDALASRIKAEYPRAVVCSKFSGTLREPIASWLKHAWARYDGFVLICAMGIIVRSLGKLAQSKKTDPAVLVLDENGRHVVSTLSGHEGGANVWAQELAQKIGATAVITNACDAQQTSQQDLYLGIGAERGVRASEVQHAIQEFLQKNGLLLESVKEIVSLDIKKDEQAILAFAKKHNIPLRFFSAGELKIVSVPHPSDVVLRAVGTPSVAEAAALKAADAKQLIASKWMYKKKITLAIARWQPALRKGKVTFIGAGPGDPELLTLKARKCINEADVIFYAGSLIPNALIRTLPATAQKINTASLDLEGIRSRMMTALNEGKHVVRLQSGDLSIYSAVGEQAAFLDEQGIEYELIPGVSSFQAAAARLKRELTVPEEVQTIILTRSEGNTRMPPREQLRLLAQHRASLCIFLAGRWAEKVQEELLAAYAPNTPAAVIYRLCWPDEQVIETTVGYIQEVIEKNKFERTTLILVGSALGDKRARSRLYHPEHAHLFRKATIS